MENEKMIVAFVDRNNTNLSMIAEALGRYYGKDVFEVYSAGMEEPGTLNEFAVDAMEEIYEIDLNDLPEPKTIDDIPDVDIIVGFGDVEIPLYADVHYEEWEVEDPEDGDMEDFREVIYELEERVKYLTERLITGEVQWNDVPEEELEEDEEEAEEDEEESDEE
ncbi:arsenate reductase/protein-tyrosine-phosphatase family protein [Guggenheimella bovis]